tara:strand:- start:624 stop:821 length:198 start_codon:yes stop_codon:yes gene_type:complete
MVLNRNEYQALCNVIDYMHDSELKHYQEELETDKMNKTNIAETHIWHSIKTLSLILKEYQMKEIK